LGVPEAVLFVEEDISSMCWLVGWVGCVVVMEIGAALSFLEAVFIRRLLSLFLK
jgi:hypothetical protein